MGRKEREPGPDVGKTAKDPAHPASQPVTSPSPAGADPSGVTVESDKPGAVAQGPRERRTTPGGSALAALLIQNRAKTGRHTVLEGEGAVPERSRPSTGSFDLLDITAVGGAPVSDAQPGPAAPGGAAAVAAAALALDRPRVSHPTPGGGLPGLLARTQLGMGEDVRAAIEAARKHSSESLADTLQPARPMPPAATGFDESDTAVTVTGTPSTAPTDGQTTDVSAPVLATAAEPAAPEVAPEEGSGAVTSAVVPLAGTTAGPAAEPSGGVVTASGPVFALTTGPVSGSSGPVFDLVSGPITESGPSAPASSGEAPPAAAAPRSTHPTPATGRLAALLAESRKRTGRHDTLEKPPEKSAPVAASATAAVSETGAVPAPVTPSPSVPAAFVPVTAGPPGSTTPAESSPDVDTVRVPGAALAQKKGPGFAATLLGLPGPEQQSIQAALATIRQRATRGTGTGGSDQHRPGGDLDPAAVRNTPLPVEGDATERSLLTSGDARAAGTAWGRNSEEQRRVTDIVDVIRPAGPSRAKVALVVTAGLMGIAAIIVAGAARKASKNRAATAAVVLPAPAARVAPPGPPVQAAAEEDKAPAPKTAAAEEPASASVAAEIEAGEGAGAGPQGETAAAVGEAKAALKGPAKAADRDAKPSAKRNDGARAESSAAVAQGAAARPSAVGSLAGNGDADDKRKARAEAHRAEARQAEARSEVRSEVRTKEPKVRKRVSDGRTGRSDSPTAASFEQPAESARPRGAALRLDNDPDAVMPLSTR